MIATECYPDTSILKELQVGRKEIRHVGTKGKVVNFTRDNPESLGIIDEDPESTQPRELRAYQKIESYGDLTLIKRANGSAIIIISPRLEEWFLKRARILHLDPADYDLPREPGALHSVIHYEKRQGFQSLLKTLITHDQEMSKLRKWVLEYTKTGVR